MVFGQQLQHITIDIGEANKQLQETLLFNVKNLFNVKSKKLRDRSSTILMRELKSSSKWLQYQLSNTN